MTGRHKHLRRRLATVEECLGKRSQGAETPIYVQVDLEAQKELSPQDRPLFESGTAARQAGRFHSLEEDEVMGKFGELRDVVARRHGFQSYGDVLRHCIESQPRPKRSANQLQEVISNLNWGRNNCAHLARLRAAWEAAESNTAASVIVPDLCLGLSGSTTKPDPNL